MIDSLLKGLAWLLAQIAAGLILAILIPGILFWVNVFTGINLLIY